ncbi:iron(III) transport system ATP-binding protein [Bacillus mesophilus]|uniref:Carnitine transport ATP-binding protein OpuCA n=1 Tax=Bacillus mesophilus TaxID=1808955 RepID=A0A6M0QA33_9BACI|nr:ABC transporter ATP-binding protein [Bacillus mesophilus]MBM7662704.1 iron(III) transport system ATP-binding protein [Bacillus mesophilus]NEY73234.1 ABC transporter ATP-binding protein [Bacillus mesophilus]
MFIELKDINFKYRNAKALTLENINLSINKGELISILGRSGSGKSTILRVIAGLEVPCSGSLIIGDTTMVSDSYFIQPEKRGVGLVFQDYALFPHMNVADNVKFGLRKMSRQDKLQRLKEVLELVGLMGYEKRYPYELSGGQQQRVALARAIAPNPSLIMFDEPFSNLDADLQVQIREDLRSIIKKANITSIFVTHDQSDAAALADHIIVMDQGKITKTGTPSEILGNAKKQSIYGS